MKDLKVAEARARFGEILDEAERGVPVFIERRGVRFRVTAEAATPARKATPPDPLVYVDPAVMSGNWTWKLGPKGLAFVARRPRKRR
jgi:hypothetical protein